MIHSDIYLKMLLQRLVSVTKKIKTFAKDIGTKTVLKQLGGGKKKSCIELEEQVLKKLVRKPVALAMTFLQNKMNINQSSHFRYAAFTNTSSKTFDKVPVLEIMISSYTQEVYPSTSPDESGIGFQLETERNLDLNMRDTHVSLKLQLFKGRLFDAFKKEKAEHKANRRMTQMRNHKIN